MKTTFLILLIAVVIVAGCEDNRSFTVIAPCDPDPHGYRDGLWDRSTCPHHVLADPKYCDLSLCHVEPPESTCNIWRACHDFLFIYCEPGAPRKDHSGAHLFIQPRKDVEL